MSSILIIKHGALGDIIQATGAFEALRHHHSQDALTLLTTPIFEKLAQEMGYFDHIMLDPRPPLWRWRTWLPLIQQLRAMRFACVYDLQWSVRVSLYYKVLTWGRGGHLSWSGVTPGCSLPHPNPSWRTCHAFDRLQQQLLTSGLNEVPLPHLRWVKVNPAPQPQKSYIVLITGAAKPEKRWSIQGFTDLAHILHDQGYDVVLVGSHAEEALGKSIHALAPFIHNRIGQTSWMDLAHIFQRAAAVVGNDTGPTHMAAAAGVPVVVIFLNTTDPRLSAPVGPDVSVLHHPMIHPALGVEEVWNALNNRLKRNDPS